MALVLADRVKETTTTTGTGTVTLAGAVTGYQSFSAVGNGNTTYYTIAGQGTSEWEVGIGTYTSSGTTLSRTTVLASSNAGSLVNFSAGTKDVFVTYPAEKSVNIDASTNVDLGANSLNNVNHLGVNTTTVPDILLRAFGDNNSGSRIAVRGYSSDANSSSMRVTKFRGTYAAPQAPQSGDSLGKFEIGGYGTTSSSGYPQTSLEGLATEAWGATARGTKAVIKVTPNTTTTQVTAVTINQDSTAVFANTVTANGVLLTGNTGTVTSVAATAGTGISVTGSPITGSGTLNITNTAPDQTVAISSGTGISVTGTYPNFTVTNTSPSSGGTVTSVATAGTVNGLTLTGGPITTTGTVTLGGTLDLSSPPTIGNTAPNTGKFTTLESTGTASLGTTSTTYVQIVGDANYPMVKATGGTNTPLVLSPLGTGALQAQKTDSTATGGNARGANAVDWQTSRDTAVRVASGQYATIGGGTTNTASGFATTIAGGNGNTSSGVGAISAGGQSNTTSGTFSSILGGNLNTGAGFFNFIGGGFTNSGTANAAVTTQSGTMNGTTAVTLSGSNASIKVGQLITGTSIANYTYVAAISGTSLTLSQAASGSSTSTLSFYTPHGVVVGGGNNQATGAYSFIGGGGDAGTAANRNVASGDWSFVGGGIKNTASGLGSVVCGGGIFSAGSYFANTASNTGAFIGGGTNNTVNNVYASVVGGLSNTASGYASFVYGGDTNTASGSYSSLLSGTRGTTRAINGNTTFSSTNPISATTGITQASLLVLGVQTTDATATVLRSDASAASGTNQVILPNNSAYYFKVRVIAGVTGAGNTKAWTLEGAIKRGAGVGTTAIVGTVTTTIVAADAGASTWTVTATADTTNGGLAITVTGQASTTIRWVARAETAEMTF